MIHIILVGALGKMGRARLRAAFNSKDAEIVSAVESQTNEYIGEKIQSAIPDSELNITISSNLFQAMAKGDVVVDFSTPVGTMESLKIARKRELPLVIGTTGFSKIQFDEIKRYAKELPIILSSNMSIGLNVLASVVSKLSTTFGENYDIEIIEMHHRNKKDAPSGSALYLASSIASGLKKGLSDMLIDKRTGERPKGKIGISSIRGGDVIGDHTVIFAGDGERLELTHRVTDRSVFAVSAIQAAKWIIGKEPGLYSMIDVLGLK